MIREVAIGTDVPRVFLPLRKPSRYKGAFGGRGSGKSHFFAERLILRALSEAPLRAVCVREVQKTLPWVSCPIPQGRRELRPLFGCYILVRFNAETDPWGDITRMPYVPPRSVLCMAGSWRPAAVADDLVDALWRDLGRPVEAVERRARRLAEAERRQVDKPVVEDPVRVVLSIGAQVRLTDPPMPEGEVLALRQTGARQVRVLFRGRDLPMWVPADKLQQLQEAS